MKKLIYLCACLVTATAFVSCNKLNDTYKTIDADVAAGNNGKTLNYTLQVGDFSSLPTTNYANKSHNFSNTVDANASIPTILNKKFFDYPNGSTANITYGGQPTLPDSLQKDEQYSLTITPTNDYKLLPGNNFADFSIAQVLTWLPYKFGSATSSTFATPIAAPAANTSYVLSWILFSPTGVTAPTTFPGIAVSTATVGTTNTITATGAFSYINNAWVADYYITPAQYAAVGRSYFLSTDGEANIASFINGILKTDASIMATAVVGSTQYVSYDYYLTTTKVHYQRVLGVTYNGTNWVPNVANTLIFAKVNNTWIPDPSIYHTINSTDVTTIVNTGIGGTAFASTLANLKSFGDFSSSWLSLSTPAPNSYLNTVFIAVLTADFPAPTPNLNYKVIWLKYTGSDVPTTYIYVYTNGAWVAQQ